MLPSIKSKLPNFVPRPISNRLYPDIAVLNSADGFPCVELFNKTKIGLTAQSTVRSFTFEIIQDNDHAVICSVNSAQLSQATHIAVKKLAILSKHGHLYLYLKALKEHPEATESELQNIVDDELGDLVANESKHLISKEDFCAIRKICQQEDNRRKWSRQLAEAQLADPKIRFIVVNVLGDFKLEIRHAYNIHLRIKKNVKEGSSNLISAYVDVLSGQLIAKNRVQIGIDDPKQPGPRRKYTRLAFIKMCKIAARLNHIQGIVPFVKAPEWSPDGTKGYFFTEYFPEGDYFDKIEKKVFTEKETFKLMHEFFLTLDAIHQLGIIHRDIKPENLLLKKIKHLWKIYIADLEFAEEQQATSVIRKGTLGYIDPYLARCNQDKINSAPVKPTVDIYAAGIVLYMSLTLDCVSWDSLLRKQDFTLALSEMAYFGENPGDFTPPVRDLLLLLMAFDEDKRNLHLAAQKAQQLFLSEHHDGVFEPGQK